MAKKKKKKQFTIKNKVVLYQLVSTRGKRWTKISEIMEHWTPKELQDSYRRTNWETFFSRNKLDQESIENDAVGVASATMPSVVDLDEAELEDLMEAEILNQKFQMELTLEKRKNNELLKKQAIREIVLEKIDTILKAAPEIKTARIRKPSTSPRGKSEEACLLLSDLHCGLAVLPEEVGGLGEYNAEIFKERLARLVNSINDIITIHRKSFPVDTLNIFALGDFVHGSNDVGQWGFVHTDLTIMEQVMLLQKEITEAILKLKMIFPQVNFYGVLGNHGRIGKKGAEKEFNNWDLFTYHMIESYLRDQKNINFTTTLTPFQVADIRGQKFLLIHGHQVRMWQGIPHYGLSRFEGKVRTMLGRKKRLEDLWVEVKKAGISVNDEQRLTEFTLNYAKSFDFMVCGHFHQPAELETSGGRIIMNNSFIGGDDYTINQLMVSGSASQKMFGVNEHGRTWTYDIDLERD